MEKELPYNSGILIPPIKPALIGLLRYPIKFSTFMKKLKQKRKGRRIKLGTKSGIPLERPGNRLGTPWILVWNTYVLAQEHLEQWNYVNGLWDC